jgi:hypothetical protein
MPGSTPIYGFPYPDPSDLVANYPALGQELAEDVETVISGLGAGLNHINTTTFTTQTTVSFNNVFTSTYANYRIIFSNFTASAGSNALRMRLRVSAADNSTSNYNFSGFFVNTAAASGATTCGATQTSWTNLDVSSGSTDGLSFDIFQPQAAQVTGFTGSTINQNGNITIRAGSFQTTTQFDGFSLFPTSGNISGTVRVYGYENS